MAHVEVPRPFYTPTEIADMVGVSRQTIVKLCRDGHLEATQTIGGHWRVERSAVKDSNDPTLGGIVHVAPAAV